MDDRDPERLFAFVVRRRNAWIVKERQQLLSVEEVTILEPLLFRGRDPPVEKSIQVILDLRHSALKAIQNQGWFRAIDGPRFAEGLEDGELVAVASSDQTAVFDVKSRREVAGLKQQERGTALAVSTDGSLVATGSGGARGGSAQVFEARTGREVARMTFDDPVKLVDFVSDGRFLRVVSGKNELSITKDLVRASDLIADACSKFHQNLTPGEWTNYLGGVGYRKTCQKLTR